MVMIYVVRHGKTLFNVMGRTQGWCDTPLTQDGIAAVMRLGHVFHKMHWSAAYSSDAGRARETAHLLLHSNDAARRTVLPLTESKNLREACFGSYEGGLDAETWTTVGRELGFTDENETLRAIAAGELHFEKVLGAVKRLDKTGMAEDFATVKNRMQKQLKAIAESAKNGGNVLVVSHGGAIMTMLDGMTEMRPENAQLENASVTKIVYSSGEFTVLEIGRVY